MKPFLAFPTLFAGLLALTMTVQWQTGAYQAEFGGHPDEAAHYVTGLMVHDYLVDGWPKHPMRFAEDYYAHYPKVALGHYPPGFYVWEALWMLCFGPSRISLMLMMATQTAFLGFLVSLALWRLLPPGPPAPERRPDYAVMLLVPLGPVILLLLPIIQLYSSMVMSDLFLALLALLAALVYGRYLDQGRSMEGIIFALIASAAIMTKGSGLFLALVPPMALVITRQWLLLKRVSFWIPPVLVAVLCAPWILFTYHITHDGMAGPPSVGYTMNAAVLLSGGLIEVAGWALVLTALAGFISRLVIPWLRKERVSGGWAVIGTMPLALCIFYSLIPAGYDPRYLLPALAPLVVLALAGVRDLCAWAIKPPVTSPRRQAITATAALTLAIGIAVEKFDPPEVSFSGFGPAAQHLLNTADAGEVLISSDARGEGAFISEIAMRDRRTHPDRQLIRRASKVLAESDWMGRGYTLAFESPEELLAFFQNTQINFIVLDHSVPQHLIPSHHEQLQETIRDHGGVFHLLETYELVRPGMKKPSSIRLYRLGHGDPSH